ncbi:MAG TPA: potassium-transporting ATPase subunit KdpC [Bacteroidales bacterium]|nr:potassium-transporting ATPase subunit KdpC [Bacteroidales bacterium]
MKTIILSIRILLILTIITGVIYPFVMTQTASVLFKSQANGSLSYRDNKPIGSLLIGQNFTEPGYFHPRPSAVNYQTIPSGASNLGPTSDKLKNIILSRRIELLTENKNLTYSTIPNDLITSSASGLDPHISINAAKIQIPRIIKSRNWNPSKESDIYQLIERNSSNQALLNGAEPYVNVLSLNLDLDQIK